MKYSIFLISNKLFLNKLKILAIFIVFYKMRQILNFNFKNFGKKKKLFSNFFFLLFESLLIRKCISYFFPSEIQPLIKFR